MSKLNIDQKSIFALFNDKKSDFLIPDYQRPYAWTEAECQTLWDDIFTFAIPNDDYSQFNSNDEYFLGPIVVFKNEDKKLEVIDGQQRLTTLMLLLRAFYSKFGNMQDDNSKRTRERIEQCLWKTDEFDKPNRNELKISSDVATDNDKSEFLEILKTGVVCKNYKSKYAENYQFFETKIHDFLSRYPSFFPYLPTRILTNCILLPIEAESQDTALRIFSTLNDRGKALSDSDIFKAQFYKFYSLRGEKDEFIKRWKILEDRCEKIFHPLTGTPMDDLFTRYMYYERAKQGIKDTTTAALRKFYEKEGYVLLKKEETFENLIKLSKFWEDVSNQSQDKFSDRILKKLFILEYAPNSMWTYFVSVYFMKNADNDGNLDERLFFEFLSTIIGFIWAYSIIRPGVNALRAPVYSEMINIVNGREISFSDYKFDKDELRTQITNFKFYNGRPVTKSMLAWWMFNFGEQRVVSIESVFEIEHIYAKNRPFSGDKERLELLGNKSMLEKRVNIRASDYRFSDKIKWYNGYQNNRGQIKEGTNVFELRKLAQEKTDFIGSDIEDRNFEIINSFIEYIGSINLTK